MNILNIGIAWRHTTQPIRYDTTPHHITCHHIHHSLAHHIRHAEICSRDAQCTSRHASCSSNTKQLHIIAVITCNSVQIIQTITTPTHIITTIVTLSHHACTDRHTTSSQQTGERRTTQSGAHQHTCTHKTLTMQHMCFVLCARYLPVSHPCCVSVCVQLFPSLTRHATSASASSFPASSPLIAHNRVKRTLAQGTTRHHTNTSHQQTAHQLQATCHLSCFVSFAVMLLSHVTMS